MDNDYNEQPASDNPENEERLIVSVGKTGSKNIVRKSLLIAGLVIVVYLIYSVVHLFVSPDRSIQQIYLVPENAAFIVQSADPVEDWKKFSSSETWQTLKKARTFEEIAVRAERMDSMVRSNKTLLSLVGKRNMIISVHKTRSTDWDYLLILDMMKTSKLDILKEQIELILRLADYTVTHRTYKDINLLEMRDPETRDILYGAFVDNHFVMSYTSRLVEAAIDARKDPSIGLNDAYIEAEKRIAGKGLYRVFVNYAVLPEFLTIYLGGDNEYIDLFCRSMEFAGIYFNADNKKIEMKGNTFLREVADPYVTALLRSGKHKMQAHEIMSARTAFYSNIGFSDLNVFIKELERALSTHDQALYNSYIESRKKMEKMFDISFEEHFLSWMSGEFALSQSEPGLLGQEPELILAIRAKNSKEAKKQMEFLAKRVKSKTPVKVKTVTYKDFEVNYIEMNGFFRLFFGNLFDKFEKPYFTYIGDYVVFSNQASSLLSFIEDYEQKNLLKNNPDFTRSLHYYPSSSTLFMYTDMHTFFPQLRKMVNAVTWDELQKDKEVLYSFPYWSAHITGGEREASVHYVMDYASYSAPVAESIDPDEEDKEMDENAESERELLNELKRFYVEKFQGNVLREFYPEGKLRSETEIREGERHGRYREYYENGKLKVRGKYSANRPKGTWKYYNEEGKFEKKEKF